jgi:histidinol phosphatase-like PHP family hydrolase
VPDETTLAPIPRHLRTDLHVHSTHSDGRSTIESLVERARTRGLTLAITDHLSVDQRINTSERIAAYLDALEAHPVYRGMEVDIGEEIPVPPEDRARMDLLIGSMHHVTTAYNARLAVPAGELSATLLDEYMEYYVTDLTKGLSSGLFTFIGHPTHLVDLPLRYQAMGGAQSQHDALWTAPRRRAVIEAAVTNGVAFEISTRYRVPTPTFMQEAVEAGMTFAVGSDSHWLERIGEFSLPQRYIADYHLTPDRFVLPARVIEGDDVAVV